MIVIERTGFIFNDPEQLKALPDHSILSLRSLEYKDFRFITPQKIIKLSKKEQITSKSNQLLLSYTVGFLKIFFATLYPEKTEPEILFIIKNHYNQFYSERKLRMANSDYKKNKKLFF